MTVVEHVANKAKRVDMTLYGTLGRHYFLTYGFYVFGAVQKSEFKGSLYQCNTFINTLINQKYK